MATSRWMLFVDGENFTIRAQTLAQELGLELKEGKYFMPDVFVWMRDRPARSHYYQNDPAGLRDSAIRAYYYTTVIGDEDRLLAVKILLRALDFEPRVFKKDKGQGKSKGVDITLTTEMLSHAFLDNYDAAMLVAGDGDYLPLVREVKHRGKLVCLAFFARQGCGLNNDLRLEADYYYDLEHFFIQSWTSQ